jgi:hypothetical protein
MPDDSLRLAVLIDADNASAAVIGDILSEVASLCRPAPQSQAFRPGSSAGRVGRCRPWRWTRACPITRSDREAAVT